MNIFLHSSQLNSTYKIYSTHMPYNDLGDLPDSVKDNLPHHAQEIFKESFNSADKQYRNEERAFRVAWSAVKKEYHKEGDKWVKS